MDVPESSLTVLFDDPFWVGIFERREGGTLSVSKITFGAEPKDYEVYDFLLTHYAVLSFSPPLPNTAKSAIPKSPKSARRQVRGAVRSSGVGTKAQQALKLQQEQQGAVKKTRRREKRQEEQQRRFDLKQQKHREKHRGH